MLKLRPFCDEDAAEILSWLHGEIAFRLWSADTYKDYPAKAQDVVDRYNTVSREHKGLVYPFMAVDGDTVVGHLLMRVVDDEKHIVRFGYIVVDSAKRGKGYGKEMLRVAIEYAKSDLHAKKITLGVFENNPSARGCYESVGFAQHGETECEIMGNKWKILEMEYIV